MVAHPIDHLLIRPRGHRFLSAAKVLHEERLAESWPPYTDTTPLRFVWPRGGIFRAVYRPARRLKRPNWRALRGSGDGAQMARAALSAELDRRVAETDPTSWQEVADLGSGAFGRRGPP